MPAKSSALSRIAMMNMAGKLSFSVLMKCAMGKRKGESISTVRLISPNVDRNAATIPKINPILRPSFMVDILLLQDIKLQYGVLTKNMVPEPVRGPGRS